MNLLLDTHVLIWALTDDATLLEAAREAIVNGSNRVFVSAVTAWEIAIKKAIGKLEAPDNFEEELDRHRFLQLPITCAHALAVEKLPPIHTDPFDRLLVAQTQLEKFVLVTRDARIREYNVQTLGA